jgi:hypothetical protein
MIPSTANTYDRLSVEPEDAWTAFYRYRDLPNPRPSLEGFASVSGYPAARLKSWSTTYDWASRVLAWDLRVDSTRQAATLRGVEEMAARHIDLAKKGLSAVGKAMDKILADLATDFGRMKPHEIARLLDVCAKLERLSRGEATERIDGEGPDYSKLTDQDLAALENIARKI